MSIDLGDIFPGNARAALGLGRGRATPQGLVAHNLLARFYDLTAIVSVVVLHRILGARFLHAPIGFDERYFLHQGWSMAKGLVPYRDFQEFKPPMVFVVNALGIKLFGLESMAYRQVFSLVSLCAFLSVTIALLTRRTNRLLVIAVVALMINHFFDVGFHDSSINNAETLSLDFFMIGFGILLARVRWKRVQQLAGGAVLALSPLSKEPMVFATVAAWLALLALHYFDSSRRATKRFALFTISGAVSVAVIWLVYMLATRSLGWYIVQLKLTIAYTKNYAYQLGWFPQTPAEGVAVESWARLRATYVNISHIGVFAPLLVALLTLFRGQRLTVGPLALGVAGGALYAVTIGHGFAAHYFIMAMAGTFFCVVLGLMALDECSRRSGNSMRRWLRLSWAAVALMIVWPRFSEEWEKSPTYKPAEPPVSKSEIALVRANSGDLDRIWNLGDPLLYVYSDRLNAVREGIVMDEMIQYLPGETDEQRLSGQREELASNPPKLVIFGDDPIGYHRKQRYLSALIMPFLRDGGYKKIDEKLYVRP